LDEQYDAGWSKGISVLSSIQKRLAEQLVSEGYKPETLCYFIGDDELSHANGKTYTVTKIWGTRTAEAIDLLLEKSAEY